MLKAVWFGVVKSCTAEPSSPSLCPVAFVLSGSVLAPANVLSPQLASIFGAGRNVDPPLAPFFSVPSTPNPERRFLFCSTREHVYPHSMLNPHCEGLEKLSASFTHKLEPADWPGASGGGCCFSEAGGEREQRESRGRGGAQRKRIGPVLLYGPTVSPDPF